MDWCKKLARPLRWSATVAGLLIWVLMLGGCTPNTIIRSENAVCERELAPKDTDRCGKAVLERGDWTVTSAQGSKVDAGYLLGFVEFDDEGKSYDPAQQAALMALLARESKQRDLSIIVFVHGWKHNATPDDSNVQDFRALLTAVAASEAQKDPSERRRVVGVYAGWRGLSATTPGVYNLSFWERKDAAHRVAEGGIRGLLGQLRAFRDTLNLQKPLPGSGRPRRETRLLTIGHSFGGLIVYSALAQYFVDRAAVASIQAQYFPNSDAVDHGAEKADQREISSYGDLVVLVNPAIEAMRYEALRTLVREQATGTKPGERYARCQSPVLVQVTSQGDTPFEGDWATGVVFPIGRALNTGLERTRTSLDTENERDEIQQSMGHYEPFWTHDLDVATREPPKADRPLLLPPDKAADDQSFGAFEATYRRDGYLPRGWVRTYRSKAVLTQLKDSQADPNNPFWVVRAHPNVILDHNDISAPVFVNFVAQLYADIDRLKAEPQCQARETRR